MSWDFRSDKKTHAIRALKSSFDPRKRDTWPAQHKWLTSTLGSFHKVFRERIKALDAGEWAPEDAEE